MPILTQPASRSPRRPWLWVLLAVPAVVFLLLTALAAWSWFWPVKLAYGEHGVGFGRVFTPSPLGTMESGPSCGIWYVKIPGEEPPAWYAAGWSWF